MEKYIIWTYDLDYEDWREEMEEQYPDMTDQERYEAMYDINNMELDDERYNLDIKLDNPVIIIADLGLWNGRVSGYRDTNIRNVSGCLYSEHSPTWYVDELGDFRCDDAHHDGTNHLLYRGWKDISDTQKENFLAKIYDGKATRADINRCTRRIGDRIAEVYGWEVRK